jgi:hypothetical protein
MIKDITSCIALEVNRHLGWTCRLQRTSKGKLAWKLYSPFAFMPVSCLAYFSTLKINWTCSSETSVWLSGHNSALYLTTQNHRYESLRWKVYNSHSNGTSIMHSSCPVRMAKWCIYHLGILSDEWKKIKFYLNMSLYVLKRLILKSDCPFVWQRNRATTKCVMASKYSWSRTSLVREMTDSFCLVHSTVETNKTSWHYQNYATARRPVFRCMSGSHHSFLCSHSSVHKLYRKEDNLSASFYTYRLLVRVYGLREEAHKLVF